MDTKTHAHMDEELSRLRSDAIEMWESVISQLGKARAVVENDNRDLINEIAAGEKRIDAFELKIDMDCERMLALYTPVANDLRLILAILKINYNLERIGDFAWGIAKLFRDNQSVMSKESLEKSNLSVMFDDCDDMLKTALSAFETDNNELAAIIFDKDKILDMNNKNANQIVAGLIQSDPQGILNYLNLHTLIRRLERVGDHTKNIAEEIIFYVEAKVIRHKRKKNKGPAAD